MTEALGHLKTTPKNFKNGAKHVFDYPAPCQEYDRHGKGKWDMGISV